ncbi:MAG: SPOR domain-containing protein, partial [Krumholzibacteria bacterium]|nr:SPOR domain-containing protein [Candidatus Krumholzibacteria bacterium]
VPPPATGPRREPPRTADQARLAVPGGTYSLQLGSFRSLDNARSLGARVEALGYAPVLESAVVGGQTYHRVLLRGLADRTEASRTGERLRSELGVTYLIRQGD